MLFKRSQAWSEQPDFLKSTAARWTLERSLSLTKDVWQYSTVARHHYHVPRRATAPHLFTVIIQSCCRDSLSAVPVVTRLAQYRSQYRQFDLLWPSCNYQHETTRNAARHFAQCCCSAKGRKGYKGPYKIGPYRMGGGPKEPSYYIYSTTLRHNTKFNTKASGTERHQLIGSLIWHSLECLRKDSETAFAISAHIPVHTRQASLCGSQPVVPVSAVDSIRCQTVRCPAYGARMCGAQPIMPDCAGHSAWCQTVRCTA